jgi:hypothetical protein
MLLAVYLLVRHTGEDLIDVEGIAVASVFSFQSSSVYSSEFDTPKSDCFSTDGDASFGEEVFDISMAEVEAIIEPDGVGNDVSRAKLEQVQTELATGDVALAEGG